MRTTHEARALRPARREKPGIVDKDGHIRNLSKIVPDISGETLSAAGLAKIKKAKIEKLGAANTAMCQHRT